jgi:lysophospholipase L1-like esterase
VDASLADYEARRRRELGSVVAAVSAFARASRIPLYFVTPYGPYFQAKPQELAGFSLPALLGPALALYGDRTRAFAREAELQSEIIAASAAPEGARIIDMLPASRAGTMATGDFSTDGIHMTPAGYRRIGTRIAARLVQDRICP